MYLASKFYRRSTLLFIFLFTNKFRTVMNIPSFVLRPKYINNVISYHGGNNMYVISYHVGNNMYACNITVNIIWKKLNEKIIENPYNLKCARVVEIQNTK